MITWNVLWMTVKPQEGELTNVVVGVAWEAVINETISGKLYNAGASGAVNMFKPGINFTPYEQLTEEEVLNWVWESGVVNKQEVEAALLENVQNQANPPFVQKELPWIKT